MIFKKKKEDEKDIKVNISPAVAKKCHVIIHAASASAAATGAGTAQMPLSDNAIIVPIQIAMITELGAIFGLKVTESAAKGIRKAATATAVGRMLSQVLAGWIPIIGNAINATTAAGVTEAIGWLAVKEFYEKTQ